MAIINTGTKSAQERTDLHHFLLHETQHGAVTLTSTIAEAIYKEYEDLRTQVAVMRGAIDLLKTALNS